MNLLLRALTLDGNPLTQPLVGLFDEHGGTVGRSEKATFTLPDPLRMISREQARIVHDARGFRIENLSTANPFLHNGRPLSGGMSVPLSTGDELRIGGYQFSVEFEDDDATTAILRGRTGSTLGSATPAALPRTANPGARDAALAAARSALEHFRPDRLERRLCAVGGDATPKWATYRALYETICAEVCTEVAVRFGEAAPEPGPDPTRFG